MISLGGEARGNGGGNTPDQAKGQGVAVIGLYVGATVAVFCTPREHECVLMKAPGIDTAVCVPGLWLRSSVYMLVGCTHAQIMSPETLQSVSLFQALC